MSIILGGIILIAAIAAAAVVLVSRAPFRRLGIDESLMPIAVSVANRIRLRNGIAVLAAVGVGVALVGFALAVPSDLGRAVFYAPLLAAAVGIGFFTIVPAFRESSPRRSADLSPRTALTFGRRGAFILAGVIVVLLVAATIVLGLVAEPDGRSFAYRYEELPYSFGGSPFPGFFYGVPVLAAVALLAGVLVLAIARIVRAPRPGDEELRAADSIARELAVGVIVRAAAAGAAASLAIMLFAASVPTGSVSGGIQEEGPGGPALAPDPFLQALGVAETIGGVVLIVIALVFTIGAVGRALRSPLALEPVAA